MSFTYQTLRQSGRLLSDGGRFFFIFFLSIPLETPSLLEILAKRKKKKTETETKKKLQKIPEFVKANFFLVCFRHRCAAAVMSISWNSEVAGWRHAHTRALTT